MSARRNAPSPRPASVAAMATVVAALTLSVDASAADDDKPPAMLPAFDALPARPGLPDPLVKLDGTTVNSADDWFLRRRPELKRLIEHYMYGKAPPAPAKVEAMVLHHDPAALGGKADLREIEIKFGPGAGWTARLLVILPAKRTGPVPVFAGLNFYGNHTVTKDPKVALPRSWVPPRGGNATKDGKPTEEGRGAQLDTWNAELIIDSGFGLATMYSGDIDPDRAEPREGLHKLWTGADGKSEYDWATIRAWAWGLSRAVDVLVADPAVDKARIAVVGHSRLGKTALLCAAFDERVALAIPSQAGCGGTAPSRGTVGESVKRINTSFPHWFNGEYKKFNDATDRLPFDQNCLLALCAPRPVLFSNAVEDTWANPDGQFDVLKAANGVWKLLDAGGLESDTRPEVGKLSAGRLGYFIRPGKHSMTRTDWEAWLSYAATQFGLKK